MNRIAQALVLLVVVSSTAYAGGTPPVVTPEPATIGLVLTGLVLVFVGPWPASAFAGAPWWSFAAAFGVVFYVLAVTWSAPRIGVGNAIFFVLLGQLIAAATIDHFGLFGALRTELTLRRVIGLLVMALGVYFAKKPR